MGHESLSEWLLTAETPSIRYLTLTQLLGRSADDSAVREARRAIMTTGPVPAILAEQGDSGAWRGENSYYTPKYVSTHWSMLLLEELAADGRDPGFQRGAAYMLDATATAVGDRLTENRLDLVCLYGNILRYAARADLHADARFQAMADLVARSVLNDGCRCEHNAGAPCGWGVARALWGLAAIPAGRRSVEVGAAIAAGISFLVDDFALHEANYPIYEGSKVHPLWFRLNFPLFYQADILFTLRVLADHNALDEPGAQPALAWLAQKRQANGLWRGSSPYRQRTWAALGDRAETDRWVSLQAAALLLRAELIPDVAL